MAGKTQPARVVGPYDIGPVIGRGTIGKVHEAIHLPSKRKMAMKVISRHELIDPALGTRVRREIAIAKLLKHPHVVSAKDFLKDSRHIFIAMDLVVGGELFTELATKGKLSEDEARKYMGQLIDGLSYCHHQGIVHRNLKPENLLLDKDKNLKITDFGVANFLTVGHAAGAGFLETKVGSLDYVAPEVLTQDRYRGQPADVWSCGVILYAMLAGSLPFQAPNKHQRINKIRNGDYICPAWFSDEACDLLDKMFVVNPDKRIKIEDICGESWFKGTKLATHEAVRVSAEQIDGAVMHVADSARTSGDSGALAPRAEPDRLRHKDAVTMRDYQIFGLLGKGAFSRVFKCVHSPTNKEYAMKMISKRVIKKKKKKSAGRINREIAIMKMLKHPHVVVMREALASSVELFLVLDLVAGGTLRAALGDRGKFPEPRSKRYVLQLLDGLGYCHSCNVCHRDLKPDNLMLDEHDNLKITDFGLGNFVINEQMLYTCCGTPHYVAPEVIAHKGHGYDGKKADIWSCGVIIYRMLAGTVPFDAKSAPRLYDRIRSAYYIMPDEFSDEAQDFLRKLLVADPNKRITLRQALLQPWFEGCPKGPGITHSTETLLAPSDYSIATAIKPVLRKDEFKKLERMSSIPKSQKTLPTAASSVPVGAEAAASVPLSQLPEPISPRPTSTLFAPRVKLLCKKHKRNFYKLLYKDAKVSVDANELNVVVDNIRLRAAPFPLRLDAKFIVSVTRSAMVIKLPNTVLPKPKYYKFVWKDKDKKTHQRIGKRMMTLSTPSLAEEETPRPAPKLTKYIVESMPPSPPPDETRDERK